MDEADYNPFRCEKCSNNVRLTFQDYVHRKGDFQLTLHEAPMWECPNCGDVKAHQASVVIAAGGIQKMPSNVAEATFRRKTDASFDRFTTVEFDIDPDDYRLLPGLRRPHDEYFLTPVFFDRDVFTRYVNNPRYLVDFSSNSYGTIRNDAWVIPFGVNRTGNVIMWLGDIAELPRQEQLYLASTCVPSDHDIASDFYLGQIGAQFTGQTDESLALQQRSDLATHAFNKLGMRLYKMDSEVQAVLSQVQAPIHYSTRELETAYSALNKVFVEALDIEALRADIHTVEPTWDAKNKKHLKHLEAWITYRLKLNGSELASPFFTMYDLRVANSHLYSETEREKTLSSCCKRLGLQEELRDAAIIYHALIDSLTASLEKMVVAARK